MTVAFTKGGILPLLASDLTMLEFGSAVSKYARTGMITNEQAGQVITAFEYQCKKDIVVLPVDSSHFHAARQWIARLATPIRTFDALHLAIAQANQCILVTADKQLAAAAAMFDVEHYFVPFS